MVPLDAHDDYIGGLTQGGTVEVERYRALTDIKNQSPADIDNLIGRQADGVAILGRYQRRLNVALARAGGNCDNAIGHGAASPCVQIVGLLRMGSPLYPRYGTVLSGRVGIAHRGYRIVTTQTCARPMGPVLILEVCTGAYRQFHAQ
tara:strand:+ start:10370 stop:10810 length:441 start_codon:yes stop_codon:yes gene_type:complete